MCTKWIIGSVPLQKVLIITETRISIKMMFSDEFGKSSKIIYGFPIIQIGFHGPGTV